MNGYNTLEEISKAKNYGSRQNAFAKLRTGKIIKKNGKYYSSDDIINQFKEGE